MGAAKKIFEIEQKMQFTVGKFYHVYNQGNNKQKIFDSRKDDYLVFLRLTRRYVLPHVDIVAYCLMPNHFHIMLKTDERCMKTRKIGLLEMNEVSFGFKKLLSSYTRIMNSRHGTTGSMFRQSTHARCLNDCIGPSLSGKERQDDLTNVFNYIHNNPVEADLVKNAADWQYSSYLDYSGLRNGTLVNKKVAYEFGLSLVG